MYKQLLIIIICFIKLQPCYSIEDIKVLSELNNKVDMLKGAEPNSDAYKLALTIEKNLLSEDNSYSLSPDEVNSLAFLYAYMPLNDMAENSFDFFVNITKQAHATKGFSWGNKIPHEIFKHYVLPPRVNNEALDNAREVFYNDLYHRVKDLTMYEAVIEVNHWCREKIVYKPTDGRTTQPLKIIERAYGRCGEESTLAVSALRSIGIPARQVYVPRWVHTNSNHAWVEVWVDNQWYYLGACEPEPVLNRGWFTESASRAILIHSFTYGLIDSGNSDNIISENNIYTEINNTSTYAPVKKAVVRVIDDNGAPMEGASISFNIINSNNLSTISKKTTNKDGEASIIAGLGTFIIEAYYGNNGKDFYACREYNLEKLDTLLIVLNENELVFEHPEQVKVDNYILIPPTATRFPTELSKEVLEAHNIRCNIDDSIRMAHTSTFRFKEKEDAAMFSRKMVELGLSAEMEDDLTAILLESLSRGYEIEKFLSNINPENLDLALQLLKVIRIKDRHEITEEIYNDYLNGILRLGDAYTNDNIFTNYVLNPRFSNEVPMPFKEELWNILVDNGMDEPTHRTSTLKAVSKALSKVTIVDLEIYNPRSFNMTPISIAKFGVADIENFKTYARALLNTAGIPNRINNISSEIEIYLNDEWQNFEIKEVKPTHKNSLFFKTAKLTIKDPLGVENSRRYSLQHWKDNEFRSIWRFGGFMQNNKNRDSQTVEVEEGVYRIVTSIRSADGSLFTRTMTFEVKPDSHKTITVEWYPLEDDDVVVIGNMDVEWKFSPKEIGGGSENISILDAMGRNFFLLAYLEPTKEPSQHFIRELSSTADNIKIPILILLKDKENMDFFFAQNYQLKDGIKYGFDKDDTILSGLSNSLKESDLNARLPIIVVADSFGNIYYTSIGYNIGIPTSIVNLNLPYNEKNQ